MEHRIRMQRGGTAGGHDPAFNEPRVAVIASHVKIDVVNMIELDLNARM